MVLFGSHETDEKFDPVTLTMLFIKWKADLSIKDKVKSNVLQEACNVGATISTLSLIDADKSLLKEKDVVGNTAFSFALDKNYEDLCIFLL